MLIDQYDIHVEHYFKTANRRWTFAEYEMTDTLIALQSIGCDLEIVDLYDKVEFESGEKAEPSLD